MSTLATTFYGDEETYLNRGSELERNMSGLWPYSQCEVGLRRRGLVQAFSR
jgi:hypothetical protein